MVILLFMNFILDCLSINSSIAEIEDYNLYYNFNKNSQRGKTSSQLKVPQLNFGGEREKESTNTNTNSNNIPIIIKKTFVSERDEKMNLNSNKQSIVEKSPEQEIRVFDTEYSFSENYRDNHEESKVNNHLNANTNKFALNFNKTNSNSTNNVEINNLGGLNFENLKRADFNDEFVELYDEMSESWRKECDKINLRKKK